MTHQNPSLKILNSKEKQKIINKLNKQFGIKKVEGIISMRGRERLFLFQGNLTEKQIQELDYSKINLERLGIYFAKTTSNEIRLSLEGVYLLKEQITKNIFELNKQQAEQWMKGQELDIQTGKRNFLIIKYKDNFLGCGKASEKKISNFIPKNRRLREKD